MLWIAMQELCSIHNGLLKMRDERAEYLIPIIADMLADVEAELLRAMLPPSDPGLLLTH